MAEYPIERLSLRELIVDFLGSLVPGIIFLTAATATFGWPVKSFVMYALQAVGTERPLSAMYADAAGVATAFRGELTIFALMLSYVIGHMFYRQEPSKPDRASYETIAPELKARAENDEAWVIQNVTECSFPYPRFNEYLESRGLRHLLPLTPWCHGAPMKRTKNFVNMLKVRLLFHYPERYGTVARNEAHIRLMSSTWYMAGQLQKLAMLAMLLVGLTAAFAAITGEGLGWAVVRYLVPVAPALITLLAAIWVIRTVNKFLHYQRVREVVYVLETAHVAFRTRPELIQDIAPDYGREDQATGAARLPIAGGASANMPECLPPSSAPSLPASTSAS